jgi:diguanylate cyclase (GGDEF)-like protein
LNIAVLTDRPGNSEYHDEIIRGIEGFFRSKDSTVWILAVGGIQDGKVGSPIRKKVFELVEDKIFDGVIVFTASVVSAQELPQFRDFLFSITKAPIVSLSVPLPGLMNVLIDYDDAVVQLADHLTADHKYGNPVYILGPKENQETMRRLDLFARKLPGSKDDRSVYFGDYTIGSGMSAVSHFLDELHQKPDVFICSNDYMAVGVWTALTDRHFHVPQDFAVTAFDNIAFYGIYDLPFTTIKQPFFKQGFNAAALLFEKINGMASRTEIRIPAKLLIRESCGCVQQPLVDEKLEGSVSDFFRGQKPVLLAAGASELEGRLGSPLRRAWNSFLISVVQKSFREKEVLVFLERLIDSLVMERPESEEQLEASRRELRLVTMDYFSQAEVLNRVLDRKNEDEIMQLFDEFNMGLQKPGELNLESLCKIFSLADISKASLVHYHQDPSVKDSVYNFTAKEEKLTVERTDRIILADFPPVTKGHSIVCIPLYENSTPVGLLFCEKILRHPALYEIIGKKLSSSLFSLQINNSLEEKNRLIDDEIKRRKESEDRIASLLEELKSLSLRDELTGLFNKRGFVTLAQQQARQYLRSNQDYTILYADLDDLNRINASYGREEGDEALQTAARILETSLRDADIIARVGGDEFIAFLGTACDQDTTQIRRRITDMTLIINGTRNKTYNVSMQLGFASSGKLGVKDVLELMVLAETSLMHQRY